MRIVVRVGGSSIGSLLGLVFAFFFGLQRAPTALEIGKDLPQANRQPLALAGCELIAFALGFMHEMVGQKAKLLELAAQRSAAPGGTA
ncbi:MAG: hypothetical protein HC897_05060, partial [Thermoanaerobaculia bacterium]|nr:hypothetical protein [Thermoanaerobaculia bacterium]